MIFKHILLSQPNIQTISSLKQKKPSPIAWVIKFRHVLVLIFRLSKTKRITSVSLKHKILPDLSTQNMG